VTNDLWAWQKSTPPAPAQPRENWTQIAQGTSVSWPSARSGAASAFDTATGQFIVFGGTSASGSLLNDMWAWNGSSWTQMFPPPLNPSAAGPAARSGATMVYDSGHNKLILFGGQTASGSGTS